MKWKNKISDFKDMVKRFSNKNIGNQKDKKGPERYNSKILPCIQLPWL